VGRWEANVDQRRVRLFTRYDLEQLAGSRSLADDVERIAKEPHEPGAHEQRIFGDHDTRG
jgi:hypothetical protein